MKKLKQYGYVLLLCGIFACGNFSPHTVFAEETADSIPADGTNSTDNPADTSGDFVPSPLPSPEFSAGAGFYEEEFLLTLTVPKGCRIYVTTDGSLPSPDNEAAFLYTEPLMLTDLREANNVSRAWVIRAATFSPEGEGGDVVTKSYFIGKGMTTRYQVPVVSLVTDPDNLYNEEDGIYVHYQESGRMWERPFHFEYFTPEGECPVSINCGGRVHGGASREIEMKSLRLYARAEYDTQKNFKHDFFTGGTLPALDVNGKTIKKFKHLLLRGGGNEATAWERVYFRDTLTAWCMRNTGLDVQAAQPLVAFLNGNYYGIMNLRERQDERYIEEHYGLDNEQVAIYSFWYDENGDIHIEADADSDELAWQSRLYYEEIFRFATTADLTVEENYNKVCEAFDINNYIDYLCVELFCGNTDWPGNNCKAWRYTGEENELYGSDGKIRWLLYDTEFAYGLYGREASDDNIAAALSDSSKEWPNQHGSTLLFRSLLANEDFYDAFISRMLDLLNEEFSSQALTAQADIMADYYTGLIQENRDAGNWFDRYENNLSIVKNYLRKRPAYLYTLLFQHFELGARYTLHVDFDTAAGSLTVGTIQAAEGANCIRNNGFYGYYYCGYPVKITAVPAEGYRFVGFTGRDVSALAAKDGTSLKPDAVVDGLLRYTEKDAGIALLYTKNNVFVQNPDANGQIYLTAVFEKEGTTPPYIEAVSAVADISAKPESGGGNSSENREESGNPSGAGTAGGQNPALSGTKQPDGADRADLSDSNGTGALSPDHPQNLQPAGGSDAKNEGSTEFILLCVLLAAALGFVTFLGIRTSRKHFRR